MHWNYFKFVFSCFILGSQNSLSCSCNSDEDSRQRISSESLEIFALSQKILLRIVSKQFKVKPVDVVKGLLRTLTHMRERLQGPGNQNLQLINFHSTRS